MGESTLDPKSLARSIDHTLLKPEASVQAYKTLCAEALAHHFFGVCVPGSRVPLVKSLLVSSNVKTIAVIGFPFGYCDPLTKAFEAAQVRKLGADEIDMVLQVGSLKEGNLDFVLQDIAGVVAAANGIPVKVILETGLLSDAEKEIGCKLSLEAGAQFVKTCTGFSAGQAQVQDIQLMKAVVGNKMQIKASGGIKTIEQAKALLEAGATRLGTSAGVALVQNKPSTNSGY